MTIRMGKLQPWYHATRPQCDATTIVSQEQCMFSARFSDMKERVYLCKTHADMADFPVKPMIPRPVIVRKD